MFMDDYSGPVLPFDTAAAEAYSEIYAARRRVGLRDASGPAKISRRSEAASLARSQQLHPHDRRWAPSAMLIESLLRSGMHRHVFSPTRFLTSFDVTYIAGQTAIVRSGRIVSCCTHAAWEACLELPVQFDVDASLLPLRGLVECKAAGDREDVCQWIAQVSPDATDDA